jgi:hypothetical protein
MELGSDFYACRIKAGEGATPCVPPPRHTHAQILLQRNCERADLDSLFLVISRGHTHAHTHRCHLTLTS